MAHVLGDSAIRPFTVDEVMRMVEAGILAEDERVELLHGLLVEKPLKSPEHSWVKTELMDWLMASRAYVVRVEDPMVAPDGLSLPEPDVAVVAPGDYRHAHPVTALLVIEVALGSIKLDMEIKAPIYAAAAIPEYWVVDVAAERLHRFTEPGPHGYARVDIHTPGETVRPQNVDIAPLELARLFGPR
jgi:Uma2 family endonuclease